MKKKKNKTSTDNNKNNDNKDQSKELSEQRKRIESSEDYHSKIMNFILEEFILFGDLDERQEVVGSRFHVANSLLHFSSLGFLRYERERAMIIDRKLIAFSMVHSSRFVMK
ncbi:acyl-CoA synthetase family member 4 [Sarcoptes scabiei]|nr:acyl-CoA synthetase family member 4 [Sarcoptes scabiei]